MIACSGPRGRSYALGPSLGLRLRCNTTRSVNSRVSRRRLLHHARVGWVRSGFLAVGAWHPVAATAAALLAFFAAAALLQVPVSVADSLALQRRGVTTDATVVDVFAGRVPRVSLRFDAGPSGFATVTLERDAWKDVPQYGDTMAVVYDPQAPTAPGRVREAGGVTNGWEAPIGGVVGAFAAGGLSLFLVLQQERARRRPQDGPGTAEREDSVL